MNDQIETSQDVKVVKADPEKILVALTDAEVLQRSRRAAQLEQQVEKRKGDLAAAQKLEKSEIAKLETARKAISNEIAIGQRYIEIECRDVFNFRLGKVSTLRWDTKQEIRERPMTVAERQGELPFDDDDSDDDPDSDASGTGGSEDSDADLTDEESLARDQADSAAGRGTDDIVVDDDHDPNAEPPELATQKKKKAKKKTAGKGGKGSKS